jgi:hypothetical protein
VTTATHSVSILGILCQRFELPFGASIKAKIMNDIWNERYSKADFANCDIIELEEKEIELKEGLFHNGVGSVIRFVGRKRA